MNSLKDLNEHTEQVIFEDTRPAAVYFDRLTTTNQTQSYYENQLFPAAVGINIIEIINFDIAAVSYTINVSSVTNTTVTWSTVPDGCTVTTPSPGVYRISGIRDAGQWELVKNPIIDLPGGYSGEFTYTSTINYLSTYNKNWTTVATITDVREWDVTSLADFWYSNNVASKITPVPNLVDVGNTAVTNIVSVIPSNPSAIANITSSGSGGTTTFNPTTKIYNITGTNIQINSHLNNLMITGVPDSDAAYTLEYRATNIQFGGQDVIAQILRAQLTRYISLGRNIINYAEDDPEFSIGYATPQITNIEYTGTGLYQVAITSTDVDTLRTTGTGGTSSWSAPTLTISGTREQVNARLDNLFIKVKADRDSNFYLTYQVTNPTSIVDSRQQLVNNTARHEEVANIVDRPYGDGSPYAGSIKLFPGLLPVITDLDTSPSNYTITFSVSGGHQLKIPNQFANSTVSYTGSRADVNDIFGLIEIQILPGSISDITVTYIQAKDSVQQVNKTFTLVGPKLKLDNATPAGTQITVNEGISHQVPEVTNIVNIEAGQSAEFRVDVRSSPGAKVEWVSIPPGCTLSIPDAGIYIISNITTPSQWTSIKNPSITLRNDYNGTFNYDLTILWQSGARFTSWTNTVNVIEIPTISSLSPFNYYSGNTEAINPYPLVVDNGNLDNLTWTVTIEPTNADAVNNINSNGSGGTIGFNSSTKVYTVSGTQTQVNSHLSTLVLTSILGKDFSYELFYTASSSIGESNSVSQHLASINYSVLSAVTSDIRYTSGESVLISGNPTITDTSADGLGTYTMAIQPIPSSSASIINPYPIKVENGSAVESIAVYGNLYAVGLPNVQNVICYRGTETMALANSPTPQAGGRFGHSIAMWDQWLAIGDPNYNGTLGLTGRVYLYKLINNIWVYQSSLTETSSQAGSYFGKSVVMDNGKLLISAPGVLSSSGKVFAYNVTSSGVTKTQELTGAGSANNEFGDFMAIDANRLLVSSQYNGTRVYGYVGNSWTLLQALPSVWPATTSGSVFSISGDIITIKPVNSESIQIYSIAGTSSWTLRQTITNPNTSPTATDGFGRSHSVNGNYLLISSYAEDTTATDSGTCYLYKKINETWTLVKTITDTTPSQNEFFGVEVLLRNNIYYIGSSHDLSIDLAYINHSYNSSTNTLTISGGRSEVNTIINQFYVNPNVDVSYFYLYYTATTPTGATSTRNQFIARIN